MITNTSLQKLHPIGLLARMIHHKASGCLKISSQSILWSIYLEQGMLIYASNSVKPQERIERHLKNIDIEPSKLEQALQFTHLFFEKLEQFQDSNSDDLNQSTHGFDYQIICWLVKNKNVKLDQAAILVKRLAREVIVSFLSVREGSYELVQDDRFQKLPKFCRLDISPLIDYRQNQANPQPDSDQTPSKQTSQSSTLRQPDTEKTLPEKASNAISSGLNSVVSPAISSEETLQYSSSTLSKPNVLSSISKIVDKPNEVSRKTYKVACIDDSPATLQKINSYLKNQGIAVLMIDNPVDALMQIVRNKPDLILLDVTMPNLDGYKLCSLLRRHPHFKNTPVIMVTGNTGLVDRAKAKLAGASGYITKPFTQSDLLGTIFMHLN